MTINLQNLESGAIVHTGWNLGRDVADDCGVNVIDYFNLRGEYLGADENGLEPTFESGPGMQTGQLVSPDRARGNEMNIEQMRTEYCVCGSYPGAVAWMIWTSETPEALACRLCESAGCESYSVDGVFYSDEHDDTH